MTRIISGIRAEDYSSFPIQPLTVSPTRNAAKAVIHTGSILHSLLSGASGLPPPRPVCLIFPATARFRAREGSGKLPTSRRIALFEAGKKYSGVCPSVTGINALQRWKIMPLGNLFAGRRQQCAENSMKISSADNGETLALACC